MRLTHRILLTGVAAVLSAAAGAAEYRAGSAADVQRLAPGLQPGDEAILADGVWTDQAILFRARGTKDRPITLRAATPGKVVLDGRSSLTVEGEHLVVSGLLFKGAAGGEAVAIKGNHCRLTDSAVVECTHKFYVRLWGRDSRVDHCYLAGKATESPTVQVEAEGRPNRHRIDHNHFGHRPPLGRNGGETIRVGYSWQQQNSSGTVVEHNLFDRCDGELEIISSKSCDNVYRSNTFRRCAGTLTLRHGDRCAVENNFFLGEHKRGAGGVRVIGEGHRVVNNYIEGAEEGAFRLTSGMRDPEPKEYVRANDCLIERNTVVDSRGPAIELDAGYDGRRRSLRPSNIRIVNNLFSLTEGDLLKGTEGEGFEWVGNLAVSGAAGGADQRVRRVDLKLARSPEGLWLAAGENGNDQAGYRPVPGNGPLTAADVGPAWMPPAERGPT
ncbi:MAG TPA: polysaccharide lyase 6 family protein [Tepidisphaeraceae bacterium]|nr:polysaccharide lyase 6 family protein [Tepidisphaeraceae bacterium]